MSTRFTFTSVASRPGNWNAPRAGTADRPFCRSSALGIRPLASRLACRSASLAARCTARRAVTYSPRVVSWLVFPGWRPPHADALERVPTSYLPTGRLVDSLDTRVDDPSLRRGIWRADDLPVAGLVG